MKLGLWKRMRLFPHKLLDFSIMSAIRVLMAIFLF